MSKPSRLSGRQFWWGAGGLALLVVVLDSASKFYFWQQELAGNGQLWRWYFLHLSVQLNRGIAFSLPLTGWLLAVVLAAVMAILAWFVRYHVQPDNHWSLVTVGLLGGGAVGNLLTRAWLNGAVVDFIGVGSFPLFNLADSAITVSGFLLVLFWLRIVRYDGCS